ncbi:Gamma interferon inducible lysosomal thiol reductase GILT [Dillenia turbinata]|uniref:Gamma interferon inducible lysosomal thiol reductase GILT n=1 Tax=Dillenia turbinata TaxID=194707 RepID=A0AAN8VIG4_9MAGN
MEYYGRGGVQLWTVLLLLTSWIPVYSNSLSDDENVRLDVYYESLCPYCSNFIANHLIKLFSDGLISVVDLNLVPYGNARIGPNNTIGCQHGPAECLLNTIEACAINVWPDLTYHFSFIYCVETLVYEHKYPQWESCFEELGFDPKPITDCYATGYGLELELQYANETNSLEPPHKYVPWVVVNGEPLYEDYENFVTYVCKAYKGTAVLNACGDSLRNTIPKIKLNNIHPVCRIETEIPTSSARISSDAV